MDIFIGFLYGVCGSLDGGLAAHFLNKEREGRVEFNRAASKLRSAFAAAQAKIRRRAHENGRELRNFLNDQILIHASAIEEFRPFVSDGIAYDKAWSEYQKTVYYHAKDEDSMWVSDVIPEVGFPKLSTTILEKIDDILQFASPK